MYCTSHGHHHRPTNKNRHYRTNSSAVLTQPLKSWTINQPHTPALPPTRLATSSITTTNTQVTKAKTTTKRNIRRSCTCHPECRRPTYTTYLPTLPTRRRQKGGNPHAQQKPTGSPIHQPPPIPFIPTLSLPARLPASDLAKFANPSSSQHVLTTHSVRLSSTDNDP